MPIAEPVPRRLVSANLENALQDSSFRLRSHFRTRRGSLVLRPGDSLTILKMALSVSFIRLVSSTNVT